MKKQNLSFLKLLCFKYRFNLLFLDIFCILLAIIVSCILLQYAIVAPSEKTIALCESALYEYLENPYDFLPPANISIILEEGTITSAMPHAFTYLTVTRNENQTHHITTNLQFGAFLFTYFSGFILRSIPLYVALELFILTIIKILKFILVMLQNFKSYISKKVYKFQNNLEHQLKQRGVKEYEIPRLQEIYQMGYNMGHADGLAEGAKTAKTDFWCPN